jgi:hypothetical protein
MIGVIDDLVSRSSNCDTLKIAPNRHSPRHAELCCFRRGHVAIGGAFDSAWYPRRRRLDVLHEHKAEARIENNFSLSGIQGRSVWLIPPDIPHAESIAMSAESHGNPRSYALRRIKTANAVRSSKYVAGEYHDSIRRLLVCRNLRSDQVA